MLLAHHLSEDSLGPCDGLATRGLKGALQLGAQRWLLGGDAALRPGGGHLRTLASDPGSRPSGLDGDTQMGEGSP